MGSLNFDGLKWVLVQVYRLLLQSLLFSPVPPLSDPRYNIVCTQFLSGDLGDFRPVYTLASFPDVVPILISY